jgi:hypothetical protein
MQHFADGTSSSGSSRVRAIAMWDFSWIERRWPGAGYENWDEALDGLVGRGYDAVRIDPYPHLLAADPLREWEILPVWNTQDWGCPASCKILLVPALFEFLAKCSERKLAVAFSTWFRQDIAGVRMRISEPRHHAEIWRRTLELLEAEGFLDTVLYVDLCNEWPLDLWAPFFTNGTAGGNDWATAASLSWMRQSIALLRLSYPQLDYCYSFTTHLHDRQAADVSFMDLLEPHVWMATCTDFNQRIGYGFERFDRSGYEKIQEFAAPLYQSDPEHWLNRLSTRIGSIAEWSRASKKPLATTEGWALVDYKDSPFLDWGWIKEICAHGVRACLATGRWMAVGTSNFCGPQFAGMWNDAGWHQSLTGAIRGNSAPPLGLTSSRKSTLVS